MNKTIPILGLTLVGSVQWAAAQLPAAYYDFNTTANLGTLGGSGTLSGAASLNNSTPAPGFSGGNSLLLGGAEGAGGDYMNSNLAADVLGFTTANYTAGAWVQVSSYGGDSMLFGQLANGGADAYLHDGIRDNNQHLGHWGNDTTGTTNLATTVGVNTWMHLDYRMNGNVQTLFRNGNYESLNTPIGTLPANLASVLIGTSNNSGALPGRIDDAVVYNSSLRFSQIRYLAQGGNPNTLPAAVDLGYMGDVNSLPGAMPTSLNVWNATFVRGNGGMPSIVAAVNSIKSGGGAISSGTVPSVNANDMVGPGNSPGTVGLFGQDNPFVGDIAGDDNDFAALYKTVLQVPTAGAYTFAVHSDDGFALRVGNNVWAGASGSGGVDFDDHRVLGFPSGTGDSNTRGNITLPAGNHATEFVAFEGGGGGSHELYYAPGTFANDSDTTNWRLVGETDTTRTKPGIKAGGWAVTTSVPNGPAIGNINDAVVAIGATGTGSAAPSINFNDPDSGGPGSIAGDVAFPRNNAGVDDNNFGVRATGKLVILEADTFRFGFQGDDGGWLRINGQSGWTLVENATGASVVSDRFNTGVFDAIVADVLTGNSRTTGDIFLPAGEYDIEAGFLEAGGGAYWEVFGGDASFGNQGLELLMENGASNTALATLYLVPEASTTGLMLLGSAFLMRRRRR